MAVSQPHDPALLERARAGDESAFRSLLDPHRRVLFSHCYRMLGSIQDAEDALQESLLGAWRGIAGFEGRTCEAIPVDRVIEICKRYGVIPP